MPAVGETEALQQPLELIDAVRRRQQLQRTQLAPVRHPPISEVGDRLSNAPDARSWAITAAPIQVTPPGPSANTTPCLSARVAHP